MTGENVLLLGHIMRDEELMRRAAKKFGSVPMFDPVKEPGGAFLWTTLRECYTALDNHLPTESAFVIEMNNRLHTAIDDPELRKEAKRVVNLVFQMAPSQFNKNCGMMLLRDSFIQLAKKTWGERIRGMQSMTDMEKVAKKIAGDFTDMSMAKKAKRVKPLMSLAKYLVHQDRIPTGIPFWDERGGSYIPGELLGIIGPSGGGKTIMAIMVLCAQALARRHCIYVSYEQEIAGDIIERICCVMSGIPISVFRDQAFEDLSPEVRARLDMTGEVMREYVTTIDLSSGDVGTGGAAEIIEHVDDAINDGERPGLVVVDWLGAMIDRHFHVTRGIQAEDRYKVLGPKFVDEFGMHMRNPDVKVAGLILHQLTTQAGAMPSGRIPTKYDSHEFRSFCQKLTSMGCLGTLQPEYSTCWFNPAKARKTTGKPIMLKLDGDHMKFVESDGRFIVDRSNHIKSREVEDGEEVLERHKQEQEG